MLSITLSNDFLSVTCLPKHGFVISEIVDLPANRSILWNPPNPPFEDLEETLTASGEDSINEFDEKILAGGWFVMFPNALLPGSHQDRWMHGEAPRLPWRVEHFDGISVSCTVDLPSSQFRLQRVVSIDGPQITVRTNAVNESGEERQVSFGEHPCFKREQFARGRLLHGSRSELIPEIADGRNEHTLIRSAVGVFELISPSSERSIQFSFDKNTMRQLLFWQYYLPESSKWPGDVFAVEPTSSCGLTWDEALETGSVTKVRPGEAVNWWVTLRIGEVES